MSMKTTYDAIVIGAGAMGSAAAYQLSRRGQSVLLLEQFGLDHRLGSSYGFSRIIRYSYDHPAYIALAKDTYPIWHALQDELGETLLMKTGGIDFGPADDPTLMATIQSVQDSQIEHELLDPAEARRRFPQFAFDDDFNVMFQPDSGYVRASRSVLGQIQLARRHGAQVLDETPAQSIKLSTAGVAIKTEQDSFSAGKLIVTAGAWARSLLRETGIDLPLQPLRCQLNFVDTAAGDIFDAEHCPVWIAHVRARHGESVYGIPSHDGSGFKIAYHGGPAFEHPAQIDRNPDAQDFERLRGFMRSHIPQLALAPLRDSRICLYTQTPDENFILDKHPRHPHVVIGAGFSGHGFKFSAIIGKMLCDLALDGRTPHADQLFKIDRFQA